MFQISIKFINLKRFYFIVNHMKLYFILLFVCLFFHNNFWVKCHQKQLHDHKRMSFPTRWMTTSYSKLIHPLIQLIPWLPLLPRLSVMGPLRGEPFTVPLPLCLCVCFACFACLSVFAQWGEATSLVTSTLPLCMVTLRQCHLSELGRNRHRRKISLIEERTLLGLVLYEVGWSVSFVILIILIIFFPADWW